jgi:hypothetical protein
MVGAVSLHDRDAATLRSFLGAETPTRVADFNDAASN